MDFEPRKVDHSVNVSREDPLYVFLKVLISLTVLCLCLYVFLVGLTETAIRVFPQKMDQLLVVHFQNKFETIPVSENTREVSRILENILQHSSLNDHSFKVLILHSREKNAYAFPGNYIGLTTGLLEALEYENEVAMVLGHELGHFLHYDHTRAISRGLILSGLALMLDVGGAGGASGAILGSLNFFDLKYSRSQEERADAYALDLLQKAYGHTEGSTRLFEIFHEEEQESKFLAYFYTHPLSEKRIQKIKERAREKGYPRRSVDAMKVFNFSENKTEETRMELLKR